MLSQPVSCGITALSFLACCGSRPLLVREIAEGTDLPLPYLSKIVNRLSRKGLVTTKRGIGGGVALAAPPDRITLYDVCKALREPAIEPRCMLSQERCSDERGCPAHRFWTAHRAALLEFLQTTTLADAVRHTARCYVPPEGCTPSLGSCCEGGCGLPTD
jgi:Rrf2 family protein